MTNPASNQPNPLASMILGQDPKVMAAMNDANAAKDGAQSWQKELSYSDTDGSYITDLEHWDGKSHQEIYDGAQALKPGTMHAQAQAWNAMITDISGGLFGANLAVQNALTTGLKGQIANAATDAAQKFFSQVTQVSEVISSVSGRLNAIADGAEAVKLSVPPPSSSSSTPGGSQIPGYYQALGVSSPGAAMAAGRSEEELRQQAITAMKANYDTTFKPAGDGVPTFVHVDAPGSNSPGNSPSNIGTNTSPGADHPGAQNDKPYSQQPDNSQTKPSGVDPSSQFPGTGGQLPGNGSQNTLPSSVNPLATDTAGFGGGGAGGGLGAGGGGGMGGVGGGGGGAWGGGGLGRSIPGGGLGNASQTAAAAAGAGRPGMAGMNGMPGMGGAGVKKKEDDEREHKSADYLIMDREEELIGHIDPTAPGAIGANFPAAQTRRVENEGKNR